VPLPPAADQSIAPPPSVGAPPPSMGAMTAQSGPPGGLGRLIFGVEQAIDSLLQTVPEAAPELEQARTLVRSVLQKAMMKQAGGGPGPGGPPMMGGAPPPMG
jgi:hypothetical protein